MCGFSCFMSKPINPFSEYLVKNYFGIMRYGMFIVKWNGWF